MRSAGPDNGRHWDAVVARWQEAHLHSLWRTHSDAVNRGPCDRWVPQGDGRRVLKTDMFDEATSAGLLPVFQSAGGSLVGIDLSVVTVQAARSRYPDSQLVVADVCHLPLATGAFEAIVSNSTLDHFRTQDDILRSVRGLHRVLAAGGRLLLTLDNPANPLVALRNALPFPLLHRLGLVPYYVGETLGPRRLRRTLVEEGWEVVCIGAAMHCPRVLAVAAARLLDRCAGRGAQARYLQVVMAFDRLSRWPSRFVTGHFVVVKAKRS